MTNFYQNEATYQVRPHIVCRRTGAITPITLLLVDFIANASRYQLTLITLLLSHSASDALGTLSILLQATEAGDVEV